MKCNFLLLVLLLAIPVISKGQYLNQLYDHDTTADWGYSVFVQPDGNYFVIGGGSGSIITKTIEPNGNQIAQKEVLKGPGTFRWYEGEPGGVKKLSNGDYIVPATMIRYNGAIHIKLAGLSRLAPNGDTLWLKWHSDTMFSGNMEFANMVNLMPDGGFITANIKRGGVNADGVLRRTDSNGNVLWTAMHDATGFYTCEYVGDGKILVGANKARNASIGTYSYQPSQPWFLIYDTLGNLLKDTLYSTRYAGGGKICKDKNGGYFHWGYIDSLIGPSFYDYRNFPDYLAHLDDSFRVVWLKNFGSASFKKTIWNVKQLKDNNYLVMGTWWGAPLSVSSGWATKLDRNGFVMWEGHYYIDTTGSTNWLVDAAEGADSRILLTGSAYYNNAPWRQQDVWVVVVDSMGCIIPNCAPTGVREVKPEKELTVYPNPASGAIKVVVPANGTISIYSIVGNKVAEYNVTEGANELKLSSELSPGIYTLLFLQKENEYRIITRLVYQP